MHTSTCMLTTQLALYLSISYTVQGSQPEKWYPPQNTHTHSCLGEGSTSQMCPQANMIYTTPQRRLVMAH